MTGCLILSSVTKVQTMKRKVARITSETKRWCASTIRSKDCLVNYVNIQQHFWRCKNSGDGYSYICKYCAKDAKKRSTFRAYKFEKRLAERPTLKSLRFRLVDFSLQDRTSHRRHISQSRIDSCCPICRARARWGGTGDSQDRYSIPASTESPISSNHPTGQI